MSRLPEDPNAALLVTVAVVHEMQRRHPPTSRWADLAEDFRERFIGLIEFYRPQLVLEEALYRSVWTAEELAPALGYEWRNIDMTAAERSQAGVRTIYNMPSEFYESIGEPVPNVEDVHADDLRIREEHFLKQIRAAILAHQDPILVLLGKRHFDRMQPQLGSLGVRLISLDWTVGID